MNPLTAPKFLPDADPIRVWRRKNGEMYIASGRHRAALARRTGVDKIMAFVYDEDDVHTEKWARRFDIELNIRDNQATALECALFARGYFSEDGQPLSEEQVRVLGMDRKGSIGAIGLMIGREAGEDVMSAFRSGDISEQAAHAIVKFAPLSVPGNERVQQAGLRELLELGTNHIDEARIAMTVERGKNMMRAEAVGATQTNLFGETEDSAAWTKFIKDYIKQKLDYQRAFVRFLSDIGTKKTSEAVRKRFESHLKSTDPQEIKKQLREERQVLEMWRNPFDHPELRQEMTEAWNRKQGVKGETAAETSTTYSVGKEYRVEDDRVGLNGRLGERAEYVEINYDKDFAREMEEYAKEHGIEGMNERAYVRALVGEAVQGLAAKYPEGMAIGDGEYTLMFPAGRKRAVNVAGQRPSRKKAQVLGELEKLIEKAIRIKSEAPDLSDAGKNKQKRFKWARSVESFGCPLRLNGEEMFFWFNGTTKNAEPQKVTLYEYGVTETEKESAVMTEVAPMVGVQGHTAASGESIGEFLSRVKNKNVVDVKKVGGGDGSVTFSVDKARERGLMKEGVLRVGNAVVTEPGVTFSVEGAQHASPYLFKEFDTKFMGKGEGNQAYGWGLYFSTNWGVNKSYWAQFSTEEPEIRIWFGPTLKGEDRYRKLADMFADEAELDGEQREYVRRNMEKWVKRGNYAEAAWDAEAAWLGKKKPEGLTAAEEERWKYMNWEIAALDFLAKTGVKVREGRAVDYLVDIEAEEHELLPWDGKVGELMGRNKELEEGLREIYRGQEFEGTAEEKAAAIERAVEELREGDGMHLYSWLTMQLEGQNAASEWLLAHGVKGVKYEDNPSRNRGVKTYNYVIFDGKDVKIRAVNNRGAWTSDVGAAPWKRAEEVDFGTTFSVAGEKSRLWSANVERAFRDPRDGRMKYVIPLDGVRLKENVTMGMLNVAAGGHKDVALRDVLDYEGLYEAYPELRDVRLRLYHDEGDGLRGFFRKLKRDEAASIHLNIGVKEGMSGEELRRKFLGTILHEAQHAVQTVEGWGTGWGNGSKEAVIGLLNAAIEQRKELMAKEEYKDSAWQKANLEYLEGLRKEVGKTKEGSREWEELEAAVGWATSGEQEARWVQNGQQGELVPGNAETIMRAYAAADLGGVTFAGLPNDVDRGLVPQGDFLVDRRVFQMKEAVARRMEALRMLMYGWKPDKAVEFAKEAGDIVREVEGLLPQSYGFALEPYKIFFDSYAMLRGGGDAGRAGAMVPMGDWSAKMRGSYERVAMMLASGDVRRDLKPFLEGLEEKDREYLEGVWERWAETEKAVREEAAAEGKRMRRAEVMGEVWKRMLRDEERGFVERLMQMQGKMRMDKLMAAFLKRVGMQLTAYRKDRVLGKIRRAIDALTPAPGKDGKPVKGRMNAEDYKKLTDLVRLMEMTKGERDKFEQEHFTDDKGVAVWDDKPVEEKVAVTTREEVLPLREEVRNFLVSTMRDGGMAMEHRLRAARQLCDLEGFNTKQAASADEEEVRWRAALVAEMRREPLVKGIESAKAVDV